MQLSAAALSTVINSAIDTAIIALDARGLVLGWNPGAVRLLGWTEEEMQGQSLQRIFPEDTHPQARMAEEMADALAKGKGGHEGWRMRADGSRFWAVGELTPVTDPSAAPVAFVKVLRDRTQWKISEDALREEKRTLEILNRTGATLARENDLALVVQAVTDAGVEVTGAQFGAFFYNLVDAAGESYTLYTLSGAPRSVFEGFPMPRNTAVFGPTFAGEGIVRSDDITKDPRYGRSAPYHGMPRNHLAVTSYLAVPVVDRARQVIGGLFFGHAQAGVFTERSERSVLLLAAEAAIAIDNARLFEAAQREVGERRKAEAALQTLNATLESQVAERTEQLRLHEEALRQAQKMEAVGQLTGGIAHDFNNLLQGITGNLQVLRKRLALGEPVADMDKYLARAQASTARAAGLTHRLLAFSRRQPLDPRAVRANPLVESMRDLLLQTLGEGVALELALAPGLWPTLCDENQLESSILNLAINARDAMPGGGRLTIETGNVELDAAYAAALPGVQPGPYVCIAVRDTGTGMSEQTLAHAFEPFFTTKAVGEGSGLGLSMIYGFARQSQGHARIFSEYGQGTTVKIYLPARLDVQDVPAPAPPAPPAVAPTRGELILVVEDEEVVRELVVEVLRDQGYQVLQAPDGPAGLEQLRKPPRPIDLLVTDVGLPGVNGRQVAEMALSVRPDMKVLFMTGYAEKVSAAGPFASPGMDILTKPFEVDELTRKVRAILDGGGNAGR
jgi:PAS domain S-box-containing protein